MNEIINEVPMEDLTPSYPICQCKKCIVQREIDTLSEIACTCTYHDVEKTEKYTDEMGIEQTRTYTVKEVDVKCQRCVELDKLKSTLNTYNVFEDANINEELWDLCNIINGTIHTPMSQSEASLVDKFDARLSATEEAILGLLIQ